MRHFYSFGRPRRIEANTRPLHPPPHFFTSGSITAAPSTKQPRAKRARTSDPKSAVAADVLAGMSKAKPPAKPKSQPPAKPKPKPKAKAKANDKREGLWQSDIESDIESDTDD